MCCPELSYEHSISALELPSLQRTPQHTYMCVMHARSSNQGASSHHCLLRFCPERTHYFTRYRLAYLESGPPEPKTIYSTTSGPDRPTDATLRTRSVLRGRSPRTEHASGFRRTFEAQGLGAHVARRARTAPLRPRSTPLIRTRSFVSLRHKSRGNPTSRTGLRCG